MLEDIATKTVRDRETRGPNPGPPDHFLKESAIREVAPGVGGAPPDHRFRTLATHSRGRSYDGRNGPLRHPDPNLRRFCGGADIRP